MPVIINSRSCSNAGFWTQHLQKTETNERVEIIGFYGLSAETIKDAFSEMRGMAQGSERCKNFFSQYNINPVETLTEAQWEQAHELHRKNHGLEHLPYFRVRHIKDGRIHEHGIALRVDPDTGKAISDSLTAAINERTSRALEIRFGLERGHSVLEPDREEPRPERRPQKWEQFRGAESGLDPAAIGRELASIKERCDNGQSFKTGIEAAGYVLARGDSRGFMVIDQVGDEHSLGRRLGIKAAELRGFMKDVDPASLPSVDQAKTQQLARAVELEQHRAAAGRYDEIRPGRSAAQPDYAAAQGRVDDIRPFETAAARATEQAAPIFDRDAAERKADEKIIDAALAADQEPHQQRKQAKTAERDAPAARGPYADFPTPAPEAKAEPEKAEPALGKTAGAIRAAFTLSRSAGELEEALAARGITLAEVSAAEARQSERAAAFAKEVGSFGRVLRAGEIVAVNEYGDVYRLDQRTTGEAHPELAARFPGFDRDVLLSVTDAKEVMQEAARASRAEAARNAAAPTGVETTIANALKATMTGHEFAETLDKAGLTITRATETDVLAINALREQQAGAVSAWETDERIITPDLRHIAALAVGDYAAVTRSGDVFRLNPKAVDLEEAEQRLADVQTRLPSVVEARAQNEINREDTAAFWTDLRAWNAEARQDAAAERESGYQAAETARNVRQFNEELDEAIDSGLRTGSKISSSFAKAVETILGGVFSFFGGGEPKLTPLQRELQARANEELAEARERRVEIQEKDAAQDWIIDWQRRQQVEREIEEGYRERAGRERERERDRY